MRMPMERIKEFIELNLHEIRTVEEIGKKLKLSNETLRKEFRRTEGITISDYLRMRRISRMKLLLLETNLCCFEVCFEVGFAREDTGSKVFKRVTGVTMKKFRNQRESPILIYADKANLQNQPKKPTFKSNRYSLTK